MSIKSFSFNQTEILESIIQLHCPNGIELDMTYGNGVFYKNIPKPQFKFDVDPQIEGVIKSNCTMLPIQSGSIASLMFDPPFLTYIKGGRDHHEGFVMSKRYGGYYTYGELESHYRLSIQEAYRILCKNGIFVMKCQDIVHNHKLHSTHNNVINWSEEIGFRTKDLFVLLAEHRMPRPQKGQQRHARIHHSFFLVFRKPVD